MKLGYAVRTYRSGTYISQRMHIVPVYNLPARQQCIGGGGGGGGGGVAVVVIKRLCTRHC
jgi:hypothetical protein